jgi:hypothetical protein
MNNLPRQMLRRILAKHGNEVCGDAKRCENLLNDSCGSYRREVNVLVNAIEERVPLDLLAGSRSMPLELLLTRLEKRLEEQTALTAEAASWAVESWALALNLATDAEIEARRKPVKPSPPTPKADANHSGDSANSGVIPNVNRTNSAQPPKTQKSVPQSQVNPPVIRQTTKTPPPLPPVFSPTNNPPAAPPLQPQTANPPVIVKKRFGLFRGCLFVIFLLIVSSIALFFGVPYAIEVMRETQREKSVEPPRFPAR